jgi:hypothetical protein
MHLFPRHNPPSLFHNIVAQAIGFENVYDRTRSRILFLGRYITILGSTAFQGKVGGGCRILKISKANKASTRGHARSPRSV